MVETMEILQMPLGPLGTNCYFVVDEHKNAVVIDPGSEAQKLIEYIQASGITLQYILLTHAHFDHIGAVESIRNEYKVSVVAHKEEKMLLRSPEHNLSRPINRRDLICPYDELIEEGAQISIGLHTFEVIHTPGHSPGGVCYYEKQQKILFSGDTLFQGSIGRTDFPMGDQGQLIRSIREKLLILPEDVVVYPGHGAQTTIGQEKRSNPYITDGFWSSI